MRLYYYHSVSTILSSYREAIRDRINFELTCLQTECPISFDNFEMSVSDGESISKVCIKKAIGEAAIKLVITSIEDDIDIVVYVARHNEVSVVLHVFTAEIGVVLLSEVEEARKRYEETIYLVDDCDLEK